MGSNLHEDQTNEKFLEIMHNLNGMVLALTRLFDAMAEKEESDVPFRPEISHTAS